MKFQLIIEEAIYKVNLTPETRAEKKLLALFAENGKADIIADFNGHPTSENVKSIQFRITIPPK